MWWGSCRVRRGRMGCTSVSHRILRSTGGGTELAARFRPIFARIAEGALAREQTRTLAYEPVAWLREARFGAVRIPRVYGGLGIAIISTPRGIMTGQQAWRTQVGGEILCYVW